MVGTGGGGDLFSPNFSRFSLTGIGNNDSNDEVKQDTISAAVVEAKKFVSRAQAVLERAKDDKYAFVTGNKASGALRRQSLELTRALAEMRRR